MGYPLKKIEPLNLPGRKTVDPKRFSRYYVMTNEEREVIHAMVRKLYPWKFSKVICPICGIEFIRTRPSKIYCSVRCRLLKSNVTQRVHARIKARQRKIECSTGDLPLVWPEVSPQGSPPEILLPPPLDRL